MAERLACVAMLVALSASPAHADSEPRAVLVLGGQDRAREQVLIDALKIYTRDLGRIVRAGGAAPAALDPESLRQATDESRDAEVLVWFGERGGVPVLYALRVSTLDLRETTVEMDDPQQAARALALKVRALLAASATYNKEWPAASPLPTPSPLPSPSPSPPVIMNVSPAPLVAVSPSVKTVAPAPSASRDWVEIGAEYGVMVPTNADWFRHGLTVRVAVPWGKLPVTAFADVAFLTAPTVLVDSHPLTARVWPIGLGAAARLRRSRWQISGGPRVSLQIVDATATAAGLRGSARRYSAGVGALGEAAWRFSNQVGAMVSITVEALLPRLRFQAGGNGATDLGWVQFGFNAGLFVTIP